MKRSIPSPHLLAFTFVLVTLFYVQGTDAFTFNLVESIRSSDSFCIFGRVESNDIAQESLNIDRDENVVEHSLDNLQQKIFSVHIPRPLGLVIEEVDDADPYKGVIIKKILSDGHAAETNRKLVTMPTLSKMMTKNNVDNVICLGDQILQVNGVSSITYEDVMNNIVSAEDDSPTIELLLGRPKQSVVVQFQDSDICVAALPNEYLGNVANQAGIYFPYSCRSGSLGCCEQAINLYSDQNNNNNNTEKLLRQYEKVRPCIYRIPQNNIKLIEILLPTYENSDTDSLRP